MNNQGVCPFHFRPRRWLRGMFSYARYVGYIRPFLASAGEEEYRLRRAVVKRYWEPKVLPVSRGKKILAISPHPDDESIGAGGFLWAHKDVSQIHMAVLSRGEKGGALEGPVDPHLRAEEIAAVRKDELAVTARMLNAKSIHWFDFPDGNIPCTPQAAERVRSLLLSIKPDILLLPWFFDDWPDHRRTNILFAQASAGLEFEVLAYEIWTLLEPNALFDITEHWEGKKQLIANYKSQLRTVDYGSYAYGLARVRAFQYPRSPSRDGALEAFLALPGVEYRALVQQYYGAAGTGDFEGK